MILKENYDSTSANNLFKIINKYEDTHSFDVKYGTEKKPIASTMCGHVIVVKRQ